MKKKIAALIDSPLFIYPILIILYVIWTKYNGIHYNKQLSGCFDRAKNKYERRQCIERYGDK